MGTPKHVWNTSEWVNACMTVSACHCCVALEISLPLSGPHFLTELEGLSWEDWGGGAVWLWSAEGHKDCPESTEAWLPVLGPCLLPEKSGYLHCMLKPWPSAPRVPSPRASVQSRHKRESQILRARGRNPRPDFDPLCATLSNRARRPLISELDP